MEKKRTNSLAVVGLILSFIFTIPSIIISIVALFQIKNTHDDGKAYAIAGIIIGSIRLIFAIFIILFYFIFSIFILSSVKSNAISNLCSSAYDCVETSDNKATCKYCNYYDNCENPITITCPY